MGILPRNELKRKLHFEFRSLNLLFIGIRDEVVNPYKITVQIYRHHSTDFAMQIKIEAVFRRRSSKGLKACNFIKKRLQHRCFPVKFAKFLRTLIFTEHLRWLLLILILNKLRHLQEPAFDCSKSTMETQEHDVNLFKVNFKRTSVTSFWYLYC